MIIKTLENISLELLLKAFNNSFSNYFVPIKLTTSLLKAKIKSENIDFSISAAVFDNKKIVAFVLHAQGERANQKYFYNAGTGVLPKHRGNNYTQKLYNFLLPIFKEKEIKRGVLEVIEENAAAIKVYEAIGFAKTRQLLCFKGRLEIDPTEQQKIHHITESNWAALKSISCWKASWQNDFDTISRIENIETIALMHQNKVISYAIYSAKLNKIFQLGIQQHQEVDKALSPLLNFIASVSEHAVSLINIDGKSKPITELLTSKGLKNHISQYEMEIEL